MSQTTFSIQRVWQCQRLDIDQNASQLLATSLLLPILFFSALGFKGFYSIAEYSATAYTVMSFHLLLGCVVFTSTIFNDMHKKPNNQFWFMLPANPIEKFSAKLLITLPYFFILTVVSYFISMSIGLLIAQSQGHAINLLDSNSYFITTLFIPKLAELSTSYLLLHSIFLFGAALFRSKVMMKTTLLFAILSFLIVLTLSYSYAYLYHSDFFEGDINTQMIFLSEYLWLITPLKIAFTVLLWFLSFLIMKNKQVSHAI